MKYTELTEQQRLTIIEQVVEQTGYSQQIVEKDWWVTQVLKAIFALPYANQLSFKGGTSLSKAWNLIERFSEDIDIAITREYLGYSGELSRTQISDKLRRAACSFVRKKMSKDISEQLIQNGIKADMFTVRVNITSVSTVDPEVIFVDYKSLFPFDEYVQNSVKIEVSGRSMSEPVEQVMLNSIIDSTFPNAKFIEPAFEVSVVRPERTFLEKVFLLHEEFAKPQIEIRTDRMSRHLYDLYRMLQNDIADRAINDETLYRTIIAHRRKFINLKGFDYDQLYPATLSILPPKDIENLWCKDYETMQLSMIYGNSPSWNDLITALTELQNTIHQLPYKP